MSEETVTLTLNPKKRAQNPTTTKQVEPVKQQRSGIPVPSFRISKKVPAKKRFEEEPERSILKKSDQPKSNIPQTKIAFQPVNDEFPSQSDDYEEEQYEYEYYSDDENAAPTPKAVPPPQMSRGKFKAESPIEVTKTNFDDRKAAAATPNEDFIALLQGFFSEDETSNSFSKLPLFQRDFLNAANSLSNEQIQAWYQSTLAQLAEFGLSVPNPTSLLKEHEKIPEKTGNEDNQPQRRSRTADEYSDTEDHGDQEDQNPEIEEENQNDNPQKENSEDHQNSEDRQNSEGHQNSEEDIDLAIARKISAFFRAHRFKNQHRFRAFVSGPRHSGKSLLLGRAAEQFLIELASIDAWKSSFVFGLNVELLQPLEDFAHIMRVFARAAITQIAAQRPLLRPFVAGLVRSFENATTGHSALPKAFTQSNDFRSAVPPLLDALRGLQETWRDPAAADTWLLSAMVLPWRLARAFGFQRIFYFLDHFDAADAAFAPVPPFGESPHNVYPQEPLKMALGGASFLLSYRDSRTFYHALEPAEDECVNLANSLDQLATLDIVQPKYAEREITVTLTNKQKIAINAEMFGGSPVLLEKWNEINEKIEQEADEEEEKRLTLIAMMQTIINGILMTTDGKHLEVANVSLK